MNKSKNIVFVGNNVRALEIVSLLSNKNILFGFASSAGHREPDRVASIDLKKMTVGPISNISFNQ